MKGLRRDGRDGRWIERPGLGIYLHVPFCPKRCGYCDFNTYEGRDHLHGRYVDALVEQVRRWRRLLEAAGADPDAAAPPATSVYFGGGTPTMLPPTDLVRLLRVVRDEVGVAAGAEVTVEANPETVDERVFHALVEGGFNRVSVGVQSLAPAVLARLDRTHGPERARAALRAARRAGVSDVNADLIYGSPWESPAAWCETLQGVLEEDPDHVSAYALTVESGTPLATLVATGRTPDVDPDVQAARFEVASQVIGAAGVIRYEVSNWARPGRASAHNVLYWSAGDYLGFGAGAHGHVGGVRWWSERLPERFAEAIEAGAAGVAGSERLAAAQRTREALMLGLRLAAGVDLAALAGRSGYGWDDRLDDDVAALVTRGLLERSGDGIRVAPTATLLGNDVAVALL